MTIFFQLALVFEITVALLFWGLLWPAAAAAGATFNGLFLINDGVQCIPLIIDFALNRIVFEWRHMIVHVFVGVVYGIWSVIWTLSTGRYIYPILDWKNEPGMCLIVALGGFVVFAGVFSLVTVVSKRCKSK